jgi:hypothetical protein
MIFEGSIIYFRNNHTEILILYRILAVIISSQSSIKKESPHPLVPLCNKCSLDEISGSHGGECDNYSLLGYNTVQSHRNRPKFQKGVPIILMTVTVRASETSVYFNATTRPCIEEGCNFKCNLPITKFCIPFVKIKLSPNNI